MEKISNSILIYGDSQYRHASNSSNFLYNFPITLNYGEKHSRTKYILPFGTSDHIEIWKEGVYLYVIGQNNGLNYIGMTVINTETEKVESGIYLNDCENEENYHFGILDKDSEEQIKIMFEYAN